MIVELAIATHQLPSRWLEETDEHIATAIHILNLQAEEIDKSTSKARRRPIRRGKRHG